MLVSEHLKVLQQKETGQADHHFLLAVVDHHGHFAGMVRYQLLPDAGVAYLWYLAIVPRLRNSGLGARVYKDVVKRVDNGSIKALVFDVEIPELQENDPARQYARRRIAFYQRLGARLMHGIDYLQFVGYHLPPTALHLMVHPLAPLSPVEAFDLAKAVYRDALRQVGEIRLDPPGS